MGCHPALFKKNQHPFTETEDVLINAGNVDGPMRVCKITNREDSLLLRTPSQWLRVDPDDEVLHTFVQRLYQTVTDSISMGVGIAAPQVGILKRIIWVQRFDKENLPFEVYLNPRIKKYSKETQVCREGCLSIPNRSDTLNVRSKHITIAYQKMDGSKHEESIEGFTAVIFQHEIDHLDGILYLDHLKAGN